MKTKTKKQIKSDLTISSDLEVSQQSDDTSQSDEALILIDIEPKVMNDKELLEETLSYWLDIHTSSIDRINFKKIDYHSVVDGVHVYQAKLQEFIIVSNKFLYKDIIKDLKCGSCRLKRIKKLFEYYVKCYCK